MQPVDPALVRAERTPGLAPSRLLLDLAVDEERDVELTDGRRVAIQLRGIEDRRDSVHGALTDSRVRLLINDEHEDWLTCGNYQMPKRIGPARFDCLATASYVADTERNAWALERQALIRMWPAEGPLLPGGIRYPLTGDWLHSQSQIACEPTYVNDWLRANRIQYQPHMDIGGSEGEPVVAASDGLILAAGGARHPQAEGLAAEQRDDVVILLDRRGWIQKYAHLGSLHEHLRPGSRIFAGDPIGRLGKAGPSGGWSHLHFEARAPRPNGAWGHEDLYCYLLEDWAARHEYELIACARPHRRVKVGETLVLSGANTWASDGADLDFWWVLPDGTPVNGREVTWTPDRAGTMTATMRVEDGRGSTDADTCIIQVHEPDAATLTLHAALHPSAGVAVGEEIEVRVRSFHNPDQSGEVIDFGDASDPVRVYSDGNVTPDGDGYAVARHHYDLPGIYQVRVSCERPNGQQAQVRLVAKVG